MNPDELRQLLKMAQNALRQGVPRERVFSGISAATGGVYGSTSDLASAIAIPAKEVAEVEAGARRAQSGLSPVAEAARMGLQGATFGLADEAIGALGALGARRTGESFGEARGRLTEESRQTVEDLRTTAHTASLLSELGGAVAVPGLAAGRAAQFVGRAGSIGGRVGRAALAGGGVGTAEGALFGLGEAEGGLSERLPAAGEGAVMGGLLGAGTGGALGTAGAVGRVVRETFPTRGGATRRVMEASLAQSGLDIPTIERRLANLQELLPEERVVIADLNPELRRVARDAVKEAPLTRAEGEVVQNVIERADGEAISKAKRAIFRPLEESAEVIDSPELMQILRSDEVADFTRRVDRRFLTGDRAPSFREVQDIRKQLDRSIQQAKSQGLPSQFDRARETKQALDAALEEAVPGFKQANEQFRRLLDLEDTLNETAKALQSATPGSLIKAEFPVGMGPLTARMFDALRDIGSKREAVGEEVVRILLGPEGVERLRRALQRGPALQAGSAAARLGPGLLGTLSGFSAGREAGRE